MEQTIYIVALVLTGLANIGMGAFLFRGSRAYRQHSIYHRTRMLTTLWLVIFGIGYILHAILRWRYTWPTAASALTVSYFHIGAICFNWGYIPLLNPNYLKRQIIVRDLAIYLIGVIAYWTVALLWQHAPMLISLVFCLFFGYAALTVYTFYRAYNRVSLRLIRMSSGNVMGFVRWMQVCCDCIVLFGISSIAITAIFPNDVLPFVLLLISGVWMFGYITYSLNKYGKHIL